MTVQIFLLGLATLILVCFRRIIIEWALRVFIAFILAGTLGFIGAHFAGLEDIAGGIFCVAVAVATILPLFRMVSRHRGPITARKTPNPPVGKRDSSPKSGRAVSVAPATQRIPIKQVGLKDDWQLAATILPHADLAGAKVACTALLELAELPSTLDPAVIERAVFVRRQLPGLVTDANRYLAIVSDAGESVSIKRKLEADILEMGKMARAVLDADELNRRSEWELRHLHVSSRLDEFAFTPQEGNRC